MKQKDQAKQNTKKELKKTLNWTSSTETSGTGRTDGCRKIRRPIEWHKSVRLWTSSEATSEAPDEPMVSREASVHWASYVPETMLSAQEKFLQHRFNRRCIGAYRRCIGSPLYQRRCQVPRRSVFSTGSTDGASVHTTGVMTSASRRRFLQHRLNR